MEQLILILEENLDTFIHLIALIIECLGILAIIIAVGKNVYNLIFVEKFDFELSQRDPILNSGLNTALELFLAAEILITLVANSFQKLAEVAMLVTIRIVIAIIVHWESGHKGKDTEEIIVIKEKSE